MANEDALPGCIMKFMLNTCRYTKNEECANMTVLTRAMGGLYCMSRDDVEVLLSGSSAEFNIKPMLSCIGDIDVMTASGNILAVPHGHTFTTELPHSYHRNFISVLEIIDSHKPGYVYLKLSCTLRKNDNGMYVAEKFAHVEEIDVIKIIAPANLLRECHRLGLGDLLQYQNPQLHQDIFNNSFRPSATIISSCPAGVSKQGPAMKFAPDFLKSRLSIDIVSSVRCPVWPPLAAEWPSRNRDHNWPDPTTIDCVVLEACDVVAAVHPSCRQDKWMNSHQFRLSFSRAEVRLLNSWTPVQQIVYHMLRFVLKSEVFGETENTKNKHPDLPKLSTYHIKTLLLWECEQKPVSWWSAQFSLMEICNSLLHKISNWVADKRCKHYFISNCNLFDHFVEESSRTICNNLRRLADVPVLSSWFFENYVSKCAQCCSENVSEMFVDFCSRSKFERATHAIIDWKLSTLQLEIYQEYYEPEKFTLALLVSLRDDTEGTLTVMKEVQNYDSRLQDYFIAVKSLSVAGTISIHSLTDDLLDVLWTLFGPCINVMSDKATNELELPRTLSVERAIALAASSTVRSNALEMLHNEMSKAYLYQALATPHGLQKLTYCVVHILLAALYSKSGQYRAAIDHCKHVLNQHDRDHCGLGSIGAHFLLQIDEGIDSVFGVILFYQYVKQTSLVPNLQQQQESKLAFTAELLAHYLFSKCSPVAEAKQRQKKYQQYLSAATLPLLSDVLLFKALKTQLDECTEMHVASHGSDNNRSNSFSMDTSRLVRMLELVALEKLINVREPIVREVCSEQFHFVNEFQILHAYRCGLFEECLEMCRRHINMIIRARWSRKQRIIVSLPVFVSLLDGELLSLFGVIRLLHPVLMLYMLQFPDYESISLLTLLLYLVFQCQKKLHSDLLCVTLQLVRCVRDEVFPADDKEYVADRLILKLIYRSLKLYIDDCACTQSDTQATAVDCRSKLPDT